jgi:hypothetical protein
MSYEHRRPPECACPPTARLPCHARVLLHPLAVRSNPRPRRPLSCHAAAPWARTGSASCPRSLPSCRWSSVRWAAHLCEGCYCDSSFPSRISASCARGQLCVHRACLFLVRCLRTLISFTCCRITYWGITCCRLKCGRLAVSSRAVSSCAVASCRVPLHAIGCCTVTSCAVAMHLFYRLCFLVARHAPHFLVAGNAILFHNTLMSQLILVNVGDCHLQGGMVCDDAQPLCV